MITGAARFTCKLSVAVPVPPALLALKMTLQVPAEAGVVPGGLEQLPLSEGPKPWAASLLRMLDHGRLEKQMALDAIERTDFDIRQSCSELTRLYGASKSASRW